MFNIHLFIKDSLYWLSQNNEWIFSGLGITVLCAVPNFIKKIRIAIKKKYVRPKCISEKEVKQYTKIYVKTRLSRYINNLEDAKNSYHIYKFIRKYLVKGDDQYHWILGESGMGKTAFLINLYFFYNCKFIKRYNMFFVSLRSSDAIEQIQNIASKNETSKAILLLDAFDESKLTNQDIISAKKIFEEATKDFCKVVFSCRTHFFNNIKEEPETVDVERAVLLEEEKYIKHYVCQFTNNEITKYLIKKYKLNIRKIMKAKKAISKSYDIMARPLLLSYIEDIITDANNYKFSYQIYNILINKWIERELQYIKRTGTLQDYSEVFLALMYEIASLMLKNRNENNGYSISSKDLSCLCEKYGIEPALSRRPRTLLSKIKDDTFRFVHQSIFEYLLADSVKNKSANYDIDAVVSLDQYKYFLNEMNSDHETVKTDTNTHNEKTVLCNAIASVIIVLLSIIIVGRTGLWGIANVNLLNGSILIISSLAVFTFSYFALDIVHRFIWNNLINRGWNISGLWYVIQTNPKDMEYLRVGTATIKQNYFNIHISTYTYNIQYNSQTDTMIIDENRQRTHWIHDSILNENGVMQGSMVAYRSDGTRKYGLHQYSLKGRKDENLTYFDGWFVDITKDSDFSDNRQGFISMYKNEEERNDAIKGFCRGRTGPDGTFTSMINK